MAVARGYAAVVTDGAVRDVDGIVNVGFPVFAAAVTPDSPQKDGPEEINVPVACGGQGGRTRDSLVGDADAIVVVPRHQAGSAVLELQNIRTYEQERMVQIARGEHIPAWVDRVLSERGAPSAR